MKKLLGIVVLGLLFCNNVNAGFHKFTFDRCNGEKNFPVIGGIGLLTDITFLTVIGGICLFGGMWVKYFR